MREIRYRCLMLDIDGTLSPYPTTELPNMPTRHVVDSINAAKGIIHIGLATSRPLNKAKEILYRLQLDGYSILHNGAQIIESSSLKNVWHKPISPSALEALFRLSERFNIRSFYSDFSENRPISGLKELLTTPVGDYFLDGVRNEDYSSVMSELERITDIVVHRMSSRWEGKHELSITHLQATKANAIVKVASLLGIDTSEIIGVGDGHNDIPLLESCGLKIAMGNSVRELKNVANIIAPSVDDDGVAWVIHNYVLRQSH